MLPYVVQRASMPYKCRNRTHCSPDLLTVGLPMEKRVPSRVLLPAARGTTYGLDAVGSTQTVMSPWEKNLFKPTTLFGAEQE